MSDLHTFGPRLRCEREKRGISLDVLADRTKVGRDVWEGLERNDLSRWPSGIFARAFVRDYARVVGLDPEELVDEFCRLFPHGDRRTNRLIKAQAQLIGHAATGLDDPEWLPAGGDRRAEAGARPDYLRFAPRVISAAVDLACVLLLASTLLLAVDLAFWTAVGVVALLYYPTCTIFSASLGVAVVGELRQRLPALFAVHDSRRAHA